MTKRLNTKIVKIPSPFTKEEEKRMKEELLEKTREDLQRINAWRREMIEEAMHHPRLIGYNAHPIPFYPH